MKKAFTVCLSLLLICASLLSFAEPAVLAMAGFTHPEIGEFIIYHLENNQPFFTIYGFVQYKIMNPAIAYRGILPSTKKKASRFEDNMASLFNSIEGKSEEAVPVVFEYAGNLADYGYILDTLPQKERIQAMKLIAGFDGVKGFDALRKIKGLEELDIGNLQETYEDYTVDISGKNYPYRVVMFYIEEEDWQESYYERYAYIKDGKNWKLMQISKEYTSEYRQRNQYIHGLAGNRIADYDQIVHDAFRGANWFSSLEDVCALENLASEGNVLNVQEASVFRLPASLSYTYKKNWLSKIEYQLRNSESYYSAFVSLYMRYYDPTSSSEDGSFTWSLPDTLIELIYDDAAPVIRFTPRIDQEKTSAG